MNKNPKISLGFTLIELLVTVAVLAILLTTAVPSFVEFVRSNRVTAQTNFFTTALALARSEAVKRNISVIVCKRNLAGTGCDNSANWEDGWIVFADTDGGSDFDAGEPIIRVFESLAAGYTLRNAVSAYDNFVRYTPRGDATGSSVAAYNNTVNAEVFRLCSDSATASKGRRVNIVPSGRVTMVLGTSTCP